MLLIVLVLSVVLFSACKRIEAFTVLFVVFPFSIILGSVRKSVDAITVHFILLVFSCILVSARKSVNAFTVLYAVFVFSFILVSTSKSVDPFPVSFVVFPFSFILASIVPLIDSVSFWIVIEEMALEGVAAYEYSASSNELPIFPVALCDIIVSYYTDAAAIQLALLVPLTSVLCAIRYDLSSLFNPATLFVAVSFTVVIRHQRGPYGC